MRNPWGVENYNGPWSDEDSRWTDDFKKQANLVIDKFDGFFYIKIEDFAKVFDALVIVHYKDWKKEQTDIAGKSTKFSYIIQNKV